MNCQTLVTGSTVTLNADKTKFTLFHTARQRDNVPLVLPSLKMSNTVNKANRQYEVFASLIQ